MDIKIRKNRDSDYEVCLSLYEELSRYYADIYGDPAIAEGDSGRWLESLRNSHEYTGTWIAEADGRVAGLASLLINGEEGEIEPVIVSTPFRNKGIGTMLVRHLVDEAKNRKVRFLNIRPTARNEKAISLYVRLGFNMLGSIGLFQDLSPESTREWKSGIVIHGHKLDY